MIGMGELRKWGIYAIFGIGMWLIYQGIFNWLSEMGFSTAQLISTGVIIILGLLFFFKFRGIGF